MSNSSPTSSGEGSEMNAEHGTNQYEQVVTTVRSLCGLLIIKCNECINLDSIGKKSRNIISSALNQLLTEMQEQTGKTITAIKVSRSAMSNLNALHDCLKDIKQFLKDLQKINFVFPHKANLKRKCQDLSHTLDSKRTTLFTAVTMAVLSQPNARNAGKSAKPMLQIQKHYHHTNITRNNTVNSSAASTPSAAGAGASGFTTAESPTGQSLSSHTDDLYPADEGLPPRAPRHAAHEARESTAEAQLALQQQRQHAALVASGGLQLFSVGHTFYYGIGRGKNHSIAFISFKDAAEAGDHDGMYMLVRCYRLGHGCERSIDLSYSWLLRAASAGSAPAQTEVAVMLWNHAMQAYKEPDSSSNDNSDKQRNAAQKDAEVAADAVDKWMGRLDDKTTPFPKAAATTLSNRLQTLAIFAQEAISLLLHAAKDSHVEAQTYLGSLNEDLSQISEVCRCAVLCFHGLDGDSSGGIRGASAVDYLNNAHCWYSSASEEGCCMATRMLGLLYLRGRGVETSRTQAYFQFVRASQAGDNCAHYLAGLCAERGVTGADHINNAARPDLALALGFYERGAAVGQVDCMYSYGHLLVRRAVEALGSLVPGLSLDAAVEKGMLSAADKNKYNTTLREGIFWLRTAANAGSAEAAYQLGRSYEQGVGTPIDLHSALEMYEWAAETAVSSTHMSDSSHIIATSSYAAGNVLYSGFGTRAPSSSEARLACTHYHTAAACGDALAMNAYGLLLEDGRACEHYVLAMAADPEARLHGEEEQWAKLAKRCIPLPQAAAQYYLASSHKGNGSAMVNLAQLLASGVIPELFAGLDGVTYSSQDCVAYLRRNFSNLFADRKGPSSAPQLASLTRNDATVYFNNILSYLESLKFSTVVDLSTDKFAEVKALLAAIGTHGGKVPESRAATGVGVEARTPGREKAGNSSSSKSSSNQGVVVVPGTLARRLQELAPVSPRHVAGPAETKSSTSPSSLLKLQTLVLPPHLYAEKENHISENSPALNLQTTFATASEEANPSAKPSSRIPKPAPQKDQDMRPSAALATPSSTISSDRKPVRGDFHVGQRLGPRSPAFAFSHADADPSLSEASRGASDSYPQAQADIAPAIGVAPLQRFVHAPASPRVEAPSPPIQNISKFLKSFKDDLDDDDQEEDANFADEFYGAAGEESYEFDLPPMPLKAASAGKSSSSSFGSPGNANDMTFMTANSGPDVLDSASSSKYDKYALAEEASRTRASPLADEDFDFETSLSASTARFPTTVPTTSAMRKKEHSKKETYNLVSNPKPRAAERYGSSAFDEDEDLVFS